MTVKYPRSGGIKGLSTIAAIIVILFPLEGVWGNYHREPRLRRTAHWKAILSWIDKPVQRLPQHKPFFAVWNVPSFRCGRKYGLPMDLEKFGIVGNEFELFHGDTVNLFYESRLGLYPRYLPDKTAKFGGIPQLGNLTAHLEWVRTDLDWYIPNATYDGLAVIDWESWRPLFVRNWLDKTIYRTASVQLAKRQHPTWPRHRVLKEAEIEFEKAARSFMQMTLSLCQKLRPRAKWGFYLFPECYNHAPGQANCTRVVMERNDRLWWLYKSSSALYPSIYLQDIYSRKQQLQHVRGVLNEAYRVRKRFTSPYIPVIPYTRYGYSSSNRFYGKGALRNTIAESADSGAAGVVLWDSSSNIQNKRQCESLHTYLNTVLGPYVKSVLDWTDRCSQTLCGGNGRCVSVQYTTRNNTRTDKVKFQRGPVIEKVKISRHSSKDNSKSSPGKSIHSTLKPTETSVSLKPVTNNSDNRPKVLGTESNNSSNVLNKQTDSKVPVRGIDNARKGIAARPENKTKVLTTEPDNPQDVLLINTDKSGVELITLANHSETIKLKNSKDVLLRKTDKSDRVWGARGNSRQKVVNTETVVLIEKSKSTKLETKVHDSDQKVNNGDITEQRANLLVTILPPEIAPRQSEPKILNKKTKVIPFLHTDPSSPKTVSKNSKPTSSKFGSVTSSTKVDQGSSVFNFSLEELTFSSAQNGVTSPTTITSTVSSKTLLPSVKLPSPNNITNVNVSSRDNQGVRSELILDTTSKSTPNVTSTKTVPIRTRQTTKQHFRQRLLSTKAPKPEISMLDYGSYTAPPKNRKHQDVVNKTTEHRTKGKSGNEKLKQGDLHNRYAINRTKVSKISVSQSATKPQNLTGEANSTTSTSVPVFREGTDNFSGKIISTSNLKSPRKHKPKRPKRPKNKSRRVRPTSSPIMITRLDRKTTETVTHPKSLLVQGLRETTTSVLSQVTRSTIMDIKNQTPKKIVTDAVLGTTRDDKSQSTRNPTVYHTPSEGHVKVSKGTKDSDEIFESHNVFTKAMFPTTKAQEKIDSKVHQTTEASDTQNKTLPVNLNGLDSRNNATVPTKQTFTPTTATDHPIYVVNIGGKSNKTTSFLNSLTQIFIIIMLNIFRVFRFLTPSCDKDREPISTTDQFGRKGVRDFKPYIYTNALEQSNSRDSSHRQGPGDSYFKPLSRSKRGVLNRRGTINATPKLRIPKNVTPKDKGAILQFRDTKVDVIIGENTNRFVDIHKQTHFPEGLLIGGGSRVNIDMVINPKQSDPNKKLAPEKFGNEEPNKDVHIGHDEDEFVNYVCRCYPGWTGEFCETPLQT